MEATFDLQLNLSPSLLIISVPLHSHKLAGIESVASLSPRKETVPD